MDKGVFLHQTDGESEPHHKCCYTSDSGRHPSAVCSVRKTLAERQTQEVALECGITSRISCLAATSVSYPGSCISLVGGLCKPTSCANLEDIMYSDKRRSRPFVSGDRKACPFSKVLSDSVRVWAPFHRGELRNGTKSVMRDR